MASGGNYQPTTKMKRIGNNERNGGRCSPLPAPSGSEIRWTRNKPKSPGYYWLAAPTGYTPRMVKVWQDDDGALIVNAESPGWPLRKRGVWTNCRWAGPILPPNDKITHGPDASENQKP